MFAVLSPEAVQRRSDEESLLRLLCDSAGYQGLQLFRNPTPLYHSTTLLFTTTPSANMSSSFVFLLRLFLVETLFLEKSSTFSCLRRSSEGAS